MMIDGFNADGILSNIFYSFQQSISSNLLKEVDQQEEQRGLSTENSRVKKSDLMNEIGLAVKRR